MKYFAYLIFIFGLSGCVWNIDKPPPAWWTSFSENGAKEAEIRMALLECGSSIPGDTYEFLTPQRKPIPDGGFNETILVVRCMKNSGFSYSGRKDMCAGWKDTHGNYIPADFPACKGSAVTPTRSIKNRLNSPYCKVYPRLSICQPDYDPSAIEVKPKPKSGALSITPAPSTNPATRLQEQVQRESDAQMNKMLQGAGNRQ